MRTGSQRQPANTILLRSISRLSSQSPNAPQTDKTTSKLTKTAHSKPTISWKTLNFLPISAPEEKMSNQLSLEPINRYPRQRTQVRTSRQGRPLPNKIEQIRTRGTPNRRACVLPSTDKSTPKPAKIDQNCAPQIGRFPAKHCVSSRSAAPGKNDRRNTIRLLPLPRPRSAERRSARLEQVCGSLTTEVTDGTPTRQLSGPTGG